MAAAVGACEARAGGVGIGVTVRSRTSPDGGIPLLPAGYCVPSTVVVDVRIVSAAQSDVQPEALRNDGERAG